ncbi:MAG: hypothetical protein Q9168_004999 [Polycauliona sp. 1 TL-2023]
MSTIVKQMRIAYAPETITATELESVRSSLFSNLVSAVSITLEMIEEYEWQYESHQSTAAAETFGRNFQQLRSMTHSRWPRSPTDIVFSPATSQILPPMEIVWMDPTFQRALSRGYDYVQFDNIYYCFRHRERLFLQLRTISAGDYIRARMETEHEHVTESAFETTKYLYQVIDVDGARSGRKKWIHTWEGADCLFFVASLAGYNVEDNQTNQLTESLMLFEALLSLELLKGVAIVLILNKLDVFRQQIQEHPLRNWFPDYVGREKDHEAALLYIVAKFKAIQTLHDEREIHIYYTDATNIDACQITLKNIEDGVMPSAKKEGRYEVRQKN